MRQDSGRFIAFHSCVQFSVPSFTYFSCFMHACIVSEGSSDSIDDIVRRWIKFKLSVVQKHDFHTDHRQIDMQYSLVIRHEP